MLVEEDRVVGVLLVETAPDGRLGRLELSTADGLLSLHIEGDTLHGNVVRPTGMEHIALPWSDGDLLLVVGTPATAAAAARMLGDRIGIGQGQTVSGVSVDVHLGVRRATFRVMVASSGFRSPVSSARLMPRARLFPSRGKFARRRAHWGISLSFQSSP